MRPAKTCEQGGYLPWIKMVTMLLTPWQSLVQAYATEGQQKERLRGRGLRLALPFNA